MRRRDATWPVLLTAAAAGVGAVAVMLKRDAEVGRPDAYAAYLRDHLVGSDVALTVVERLQLSHAGTPEGDLFARLQREFTEERAVVRSLLRQLGASPWSAKRVTSLATGSLAQLAMGGVHGSLALFRTLEALAVAVQGKRLLWRVAQRLELHRDAGSATSLSALEAQALDQWEHLEARRQALALLTFGASIRELPEADI